MAALDKKQYAKAARKRWDQLTSAVLRRGPDAGLKELGAMMQDAEPKSEAVKRIEDGNYRERAEYQRAKQEAQARSRAYRRRVHTGWTPPNKTA